MAGTKKYSQTARHLAAAACKVARANHYMVGFDAEMTADISFEDFTDAHTILVDAELKRNSKQGLDLAFGVLDRLCFQRHRTHLGV